MQSKLTLRLDKTVIEDMKLHALKHQQSLSALTESLYLEHLKSEAKEDKHLTPIAKKYQGLLQGQNIDDESEKAAYLNQKHQHG